MIPKSPTIITGEGRGLVKARGGGCPLYGGGGMSFAVPPTMTPWPRIVIFLDRPRLQAWRISRVMMLPPQVVSVPATWG